ncbi:MAG: NAD(P)-dependent glycerol-3-phosphate dehydrogenase [Nitrospiraceae bacterium]|nr:NAD(P)-dependent glycerol-3-phosphate dehydrogenase [Nitrospiraceae bacterium]MDA8089634.1 NAD(P)-dependent glycerol-3-phosphate dehydrogenase [Nitrospiraceae bacterium]
MSYSAVIGAGSWGTTIAALLAGKDLDVSLWVREEDLALEIERTRINSVYLPGAELPHNIKASSNIEEVLEGARYVINVVPTQHIRSVFGGAVRFLANKKISLISASKGVENTTLKRPSEILKELTGRDAAVLSGPSFAKEVLERKPTAVTLAAKDRTEALLLQELLNTSYFRVYTHEDVTGVEMGGALKNVVAIASGISDGLGLGNNARAALITRGLAEMKRLGMAMGAMEQTFFGLSGMGDLVLTCTASLSRNYSFGLKLAAGLSAGQISAGSKSIAEGVATSKSIVELSERHGVEMPIARQVYNVVFDGKSPIKAVEDLMGRSLKHEFGD